MDVFRTKRRHRGPKPQAILPLSGWTVDDMQLKRSVAMVVNCPEIQTKKRFDFATFSRKEKPYPEAKQEYDKQVTELTDWIGERARHYAQAMGHGGPADFAREF